MFRGGGGGGCTLIFSYICRVFLGFEILNFFIFGFFRKKMGVPPPPTVRGCMLSESILPNRVMKWEKGLS